LLPKIETISKFLYIHSNTAIKSVNSAFPALVSVGGYFYFYNNDALESIGSAFPALVSVGEYLRVYSNDALVSLNNAFPALVSVGDYLYINSNSALKSANNAFSALVSVGDYLQIGSNSKLATLDGTFAALTNVSGYIYIQSNPALQTFDGAFGKVVAVGQYVRIYNNDALSSLDGIFPLLVTVGERVAIESNDNSALTSMSNSFPALTSATHIYINDNDNLQTVKTSFNNVKELSLVGAGLQITNNDNLVDVPDFQKDVTFRGTVVNVYRNPNLASLDGLDKLLCVNSAGCTLSWYTNPQLTKEDVCGVWTALTRPGSTGGPQQEYSSASSGSYRPAYGPEVYPSGEWYCDSYGGSAYCKEDGTFAECS
jgi:hypothetical protein